MLLLAKILGGLLIFILILLIVSSPILIGLGIYALVKKSTKKKSISAETVIKERFILKRGAVFKDPSQLLLKIKIMTVLEVIFLIFAFALHIHHMSFSSSITNSLWYLIGTAVMLTKFIFILIWLYQANFNAHQLGAQGMVHSPKDAVIWTFRPLYIYYVLKEILLASLHLSNQWKNKPTPDIFKIWWLLVILKVVLAFTRVLFPQSVQNAALMLVQLLAISSAILLIIIMDKVSRQQISHHETQRRRGTADSSDLLTATT